LRRRRKRRTEVVEWERREEQECKKAEMKDLLK
jgi:hypothetical protein